MQTYPLYLNNQWIETNETIEVTNPADGEPFARVTTVDRPRVAQALADAHTAFAGWRSLTAVARGDYLLTISEQIKKRADEIARIITMENGKPLAQSKGEVAMTIDHFRWFAQEGPRAYGRIVPHQTEGKRHMVLKSPIGVVGAISPWNFPLVLAVRKVAPALAAGCPVILKPASATPLCVMKLAQCVEAAALPPGVFQVVLGSASQIAQEMLSNPVCRKISFTGSTQVGKKLIHGAAETVTRLSLELGGQAPVLIFADADLDLAVESTIVAKFRNTGQSCIAANRIYVQSSIYDRFVQRFVERTRQLKVGSGLDKDVDIGPLINKEALRHALKHIEEATSRGAVVRCGGQQVGKKGFLLEPTILTDMDNDALCMHEETFAPIAPVARFETEQQAVDMANATDYGLAAYVFTRDLNRLWRLAESLEAGTIGFNDGAPAASQCPFGGFKQSGWGRELGAEGLDAFLETKHVSIGGVQ